LVPEPPLLTYFMLLIVDGGTAAKFLATTYWRFGRAFIEIYNASA
jgi:hypothetical protein